MSHAILSDSVISIGIKIEFPPLLLTRFINAWSKFPFFHSNNLILMHDTKYLDYSITFRYVVYLDYLLIFNALGIGCLVYEPPINWTEI